MAKIKTSEFEKNCKVCGVVFIGTGPAALYCDVHVVDAKAALAKKAREKVAKIRADSGRIKMPGVGKGGNPYYGKDNPSYKHGYYMPESLRKDIKLRRFCERCDLDLQDVSRWMWCMHHRDHNHCNNEIENLELLCKKCHQIEHQCHRNFDKGATTIPQGSTD